MALPGDLPGNLEVVNGLPEGGKMPELLGNYMVKCACSDCVCVVDVAKGLERDGCIYCGDACADHQKSGAGC